MLLIAPPAAPAAAPIALPAIINSPSILPPVRPTLMPSADIKLSIFWLALRNAIAHKNQMKMLPATSSRLVAAIALSTSLSSMASAGATSALQRRNTVMANIMCFFNFTSFSFPNSRLIQIEDWLRRYQPLKQRVGDTKHS